MSISSSDQQGGGRASTTLCPIVQHYLPLLALCDLRPGLARAVYHHLDTCAACADELEQYEDITRLLRAPRRGRSRDTSNSQRKVDTYRDTMYPSHETGATGAVAYARKRNEMFRRAFDEALTGTPHPDSDLKANDYMDYVASNSDSSGESPQRLSLNAAPSDAFAAAVRRTLATIAQQWPEPVGQPWNEDF